jgi:AcrR family transcriptional regulator
VAVDLADREDLSAVSMRRIAAALGVAAPSLYWHVKNKNELFELMADAVVGEVPLPEQPSGDWRRDLREIAHDTRETLGRHRWYAQLGISPTLGPNTQRYAERATATLRELSLSAAEEVEILAALNNYIIGFIHREHAWHELVRRSGLPDRQWTRLLADLISDRAREDAHLAEQMRARIDLHTDHSFAYGLDCLIEGIAARAARSAKA